MGNIDPETVKYKLYHILMPLERLPVNNRWSHSPGQVTQSCGTHLSGVTEQGRDRDLHLHLKTPPSALATSLPGDQHTGESR